MKDGIYNELYKIPTQKFKSHFGSQLNERILFSGKFGKGKTTFLKYFFKNQSELRIGDEYFPIHISPINYAVASNEDIFKYIKYDIILEFLRNNFEFEESDFNFMDSLPLFIRKHPEKIIGKLLSFIPVVGKEIDEVFEKGKKLYEEVKKHNSEVNDKGEANQLEKYIETIETAEGSIYENDFITKIIEKAISKLENEKKKAVLIIDDLDRLDPDHIFRILNVFASQFDNYNSTKKINKFNFSKIIVVCDLDNIRNIYKNRYGANVDFNGYVNKFYSTDPFIFNNYQDLKDIVYKILDQIAMIGYNNEKTSFMAYINTRNTRSIGIREIIKNLLFFDFISLRALLIYANGRSFNLTEGYSVEDSYIENETYPVIIEVQIITNLLGGYENSIHVLDKLKYESTSVLNYEHCFKRILYFLSYPQGGYSSVESEGTQFEYDGKLLFYKIKNNQLDNIKYSVNGNLVDFIPSKKDYFTVLELIFQKMYINGIVE